VAHVAARPPKGPICFMCHRRGNVAPCAYCKRVRPVSSRTARGHAVCARCTFTRCAPLRICAVCRETKRTRRRTSDGGPLCDRCYSRARTKVA
jgi:hypothetical protein